MDSFWNENKLTDDFGILRFDVQRPGQLVWNFQQHDTGDELLYLHRQPSLLNGILFCSWKCEEKFLLVPEKL